MYPRISIVTPNFNGARFLEKAIESVTEQHYPNLEYIIIDGGSTDESLGILKKHSENISFWISEKDSGMYHAILKGFARSTGEIMGWLNSDDILQKNSLFSLAEIFSQEEIKWIQGYPNVIDSTGRIIYHREPISSKYSFYLKEYRESKFIQQESTFWRRDLWESSGGGFSETLKYAGDFELWMRFFQFTNLYCTKTILGSFRMQGNSQISELYHNEYIFECDKIIEERLGSLKSDEIIILRLLRMLRKIKKRASFFYKVFLLKKIENKYLKSHFITDYDVHKNKYIIYP
jgi:glycosyltransferase involved in cell wall biosynthesis